MALVESREQGYETELCAMGSLALYFHICLISRLIDLKISI